MDIILGMIQIMVTISIFVLILWIADKNIQLKTGHLWRKWLWGFFCFRLLFPLPVHPELPVMGRSVIEVQVPEYRLPETTGAIAAESSKGEEIKAGETAAESEGNQTGTQTLPGEAKEETTWKTLLFTVCRNMKLPFLGVIWAAGFLLTLRIHISQYLYIRKIYVEAARPCEDERLLALEKRIAKEYGLRTLPPMVIQNKIQSPLTYGYMDPKLLLPMSYDRKELGLILRHELMHVRHYDLWYKFLVVLICDVYWFNPLLRLMKQIAFQDVEYVCDERVARSMTQEERSAYGKVILKTMRSEDIKNVPMSAPFAAKKHMMRRRLENLFVTAPPAKGFGVLLGILVVFVVCTSVISVTGQEAQGSFTERAAAGKQTELPVYLAEDVSSLHMDEDFKLENYYVKNVQKGANYFYIDENNVLWGCGDNSFGQLGQGYQSDRDDPRHTEEPEKIAEHVVHVDFSGEFFAIFLTDDGKLYGMGANLNGIMGMEVPERADYFFNPKETAASSPVLLMENVTYARCGYRHMVALKEDGSVWWWGEIRTSISRTGNDMALAGSGTPVKVLDHARYVTSGSYTMAAIGEDNWLWTWGNNSFGTCGVCTEETDFVPEPQKAAGQVKMVWIDQLGNQMPREDFIPFISWEQGISYEDNMFVQKLDGSFMACGKDVPGENERAVVFHTYGRTDEPESVRCSEEFSPIMVMDKSVYEEKSTETEAVSEAPDKEMVLQKRELIQSSMTEEHYKELKNFVQTANLRLESMMLYDNLFLRLEDPDALCWNYFEKRGEIQIGWGFDGDMDLSVAESDPEKYGMPVVTNNPYDGEVFIQKAETLAEYTEYEKLRLDLISLAENMRKALKTHDGTYVENLYHILHDLDYFALRYGLEDFGDQVRDKSTLAKYYGVLNIYSR